MHLEQSEEIYAWISNFVNPQTLVYLLRGYMPVNIFCQLA